MDYYERSLPHWHPEGAAIFVTWRLHGTYDKFRTTAEKDPGRAFVEFDRILDEAKVGPKWLSNPEIAGVMQDAFLFGERQLNLYSLVAYSIMPNHVHLVVLPKVGVPRITKSIKGFTARKANEILERVGERFWQDESYDHWVRGDRELQKIIAYVEKNPVRAGLAASIEEWPWSSASAKDNTGKNACATQTQTQTQNSGEGNSRTA